MVLRLLPGRVEPPTMRGGRTYQNRDSIARVGRTPLQRKSDSPDERKQLSFNEAVALLTGTRDCIYIDRV